MGDAVDDHRSGLWLALINVHENRFSNIFQIPFTRLSLRQCPTPPTDRHTIKDRQLDSDYNGRFFLYRGGGIEEATL
jgi:hypothetical protein